MKIKDIYLEEFGPYKDWSFKPDDKGVQLLYGPNESGKTTLLEAIRTLLFGGKAKGFDHCKGTLTVERNQKEFHIGRNQKKLDFYPVGESPIKEEPASLWWHGLDKKTYNRIFALTLEDLQGADVLKEVDVRTRFFGAEGGEKLSAVVKDLEKATNDLLVASANGKRKINVLMERLKQNRSHIAELSTRENEYNQWQAQLQATNLTEKELLDQLEQRHDYVHSLELVLQAWDTYRRAEDAKLRITNLGASKDLESKAFLDLDQEINRCREHMRVWQGKEASLMPDNFSPDSPLGLYSQEIEALYQEISKWEQLRKECDQGTAYLHKVKEQLQLSRKMHTAWREDVPMDSDINWFEGERLARNLRSAREAYQQWEYRKPICPVDLQDKLPSQESKANLEKMSEGLHKIRQTYLEKKAAESKSLRSLNSSDGNPKMYMTALIIGIVGLGFFFAGLADVIPTFLLGLCILFVALGLGVYTFWNNNQKHKLHVELLDKIRQLDGELEDLASRYNLGIPSSDEDMAAMQKDYESRYESNYSHNFEMAQLHGYEQQVAQWEEEGKRLEANGKQVMDQWQAWLPEAAAKTLTDVDFFGMKQEYDSYMEQLNTYHGYESRLEEHKEALQNLEDRAADLWEHIDYHGSVSPQDMRRVYNALKTFNQNRIRWEQKESQRKSFREEYDQWNRKEKDLLLQQDELIHRAGLQSAAEYRQKLLQQGQLKQWETIYQQSKIQLDLLAKQDDNPDLLYRRLKRGNRQKYLDEMEQSKGEIIGLEQKLADLYEKRGKLQEAMRVLARDKELAQALQERQSLEAQLQEALEDWVTQVLIRHCMDSAQEEYEKDKQPHMMEIASEYIEFLTGGKYTLDVAAMPETVYLKDSQGNRWESKYWSSGLGDQVYLALRLSLAKVFSTRVEALPIILDDILLRFDEERQARALALLSQIGESQQVWIFTCQKELLRMGQKQLGIQTYRLEDGGVKVFA